MSRSEPDPEPAREEPTAETEGSTADPGDPKTGTEESIHREYPLDVRIVECSCPDSPPRYRFEAPHHEGRTFTNPDTAELYADVYFDVNGFEEAGTGERGVPPVVIQAGRDTLAAYFLTQPNVDEQWVGSFMGAQPGKIERYASRVRKRAENIRNRVVERGLDEA